ncbi:MAG: tetratricopeptide repeat protein [Bacteroidaceae bacterium]|nr:tetratricopeptide repeat protein [Bacteroidaceae bacterium]
MTTDIREQAQALYEEGNLYRKQQQWSLALNAYEQAANLDPASPAVHARQMLQQIMDYRCKEYYNP